MSDNKSFTDQFHDLVAMSIDDKGVYPQQAMAVDGEGRLSVFSLALPAPQIYEWFGAQLLTGGHCQIIFGVDRFTRPGQGTEFADVITCCHWRKEAADGLHFRIGVINYQHQPRIVRPFDWDNEYWGVQMAKEMAFLPGGPKRERMSHD